MALSAFRTAIWIPYPTANPGNGFWGEQTSTLNFCEEVSERVCGSFFFFFFSFSLSNTNSQKDYALSSYCAEFCNVSIVNKLPFSHVFLLTPRQTVTNALFLWLGIRGIINCIQQKHPSIFLISYIGYMVVGLGSILFHTTLKCKCRAHGDAAGDLVGGKLTARH